MIRTQFLLSIGLHFSVELDETAQSPVLKNSDGRNDKK